jgi:hypothetical protein
MRIVLACIAFIGCGGADVTPATPKNRTDTPTTHLLLRIESVVVADKQPNGQPWDTPEAPGAEAACRVFAETIGIGSAAIGEGLWSPPIGKGAELLCTGAPPITKQERNRTNPDVQVRVLAEGASSYRTDVVADSTEATFRHAFVVPIDAIAETGVIVEVVDNDAKEIAQPIAALRFARDELLGIANSPSKRVTKDQTPSLIKLVLAVAAYRGHDRIEATMSAKDGVKVSPAELDGGEVVRITATGSFSVGSYYNQNLTPTGWTGGGKEYNFENEPLHSAPHGSGFVLLGGRDRVPVLVNPCGAFVAPFSGPLAIGVDDNDPGNNTGDLAFVIERRAPTVEEWRTHQTSERCTP